MQNDALFINKIAAAILTAALIAMTAGLIASFIYHPQTELAQNAYVIEVSETDTAQADAPAEPAGPGEISPLLADASVSEGEKLTRRCSSCHAFEKGGPNKTGPGLWNIVNAEKAAHEGYSYSDALKSMGGQWTYENLNAFLYDPKAYVEGTKMAFRGLPKAEDRADLIAYMRTLSDDPAPLP